MPAGQEPREVTPAGPGAQPPAFELLAPGVQRRLWDMKWSSLRPIQADAIRAYLSTPHDLLIMAETAGGKTEAAFLPVLSSIADEPAGSVRALYIGPLKALINDQFGRLEHLCEHMQMPVHRWHGDVGEAQRKRLMKEPSGVLLITPESIESLLVNRTFHLGNLFGGLRAIVIDELHSFLEGERGLHLASLLARLDRYVADGQTRPRRIGLSATIGDPDAARQYLNPDRAGSVLVLSDPGEGKEIQLRVHAIRPAVHSAAETEEDDEADIGVDWLRHVARELAERCRGTSNLVFANRKGDIELLADMANRECRAQGVPECFLVHHGSLSKDIREDTESIMKSGRPHTAICSSTLEMGIDIGSVRTVCQVGPPWSVASLKQRMGRSGRRDDEPRRLRMFVEVPAVGQSDDPLDVIPVDLLQTLAVVDLMLAGWVDPPAPASCDLSTLTQQIISVIAETGGTDAKSLHETLCVRGPFRAIEPKLFADLLRCLGAGRVVEQTPEGDLILGTPTGEDIRASKDFYSAFVTPVEFQVVHSTQPIGVLPATTAPMANDHLVLAGRRWKIESVNAESLKIHVVPARGAKRPPFQGQLGEVHPRIRERMREILAGDQEFSYLDAAGREALARARHAAAAQGLQDCGVRHLGDRTSLWMTWTGTKRQRTLQAALAVHGLTARDRRIALEVDVPATQIVKYARALEEAMPSTESLAAHVQPKQSRKYDDRIDPRLLEIGIARDRLSR